MRASVLFVAVFLLAAAAAGAQQLTIAPSDPLAIVAEGRDGAHVTYDVVVYGGSDPNPTVKCDPPSGSLFPLGPNNVHCVATNSFGERAEGGVYIFVYDAGIPFLKLPDDIVTKAESREGAVVTYEVSAEDAIDGPLPVTCSHESGSIFPVGETTVDCTAIDESLNYAFGSFKVTVTSDQQDERLIIHVPDPIAVEAEGPQGATVTFTVTADGTSDPDPDISCQPSSGSTFPLGTNTVNCVATDNAGNMAAGDFTVTVLDTGAPALTLPDPITVQADGPDGATVTYEAKASDTVDSDVTVSCDPPSGSRFPVGRTTVHCSATDDSLNRTNGSFTVEVTEEDDPDTVPPIISSVSATPDILSPPNSKLVPVTITVEASDIVDPMPRCFVFTVTSNDSISGDYKFKSDLEIELRAERDGGDERIYTVHVRCVDDAANAVDDSVIVRVPKGGEQSTTPPAESTITKKGPFRKWW